MSISKIKVDGTEHELIAASATKDASGNTITSTYETKSAATSKLAEAKSYTDNAVAQKSQVQFIIWGADD